MKTTRTASKKNNNEARNDAPATNAASKTRVSKVKGSTELRDKGEAARIIGSTRTRILPSAPTLAGVAEFAPAHRAK
jgi:hypothetical protein